MVVLQFLRVNVDMILLGEPAESAVADHARHGAELARDNPVVDRLLVEQIVVGALDRVAVDLADRIFGRDTRRDTRRKADKLELVDGLGVVPVVVAIPREIAADVRKAEQRNRAHRLQVARRAERVFQRHRDQPLDLFGAEPVGQRQAARPSAAPGRDTPRYRSGRRRRCRTSSSAIARPMITARPLSAICINERITGGSYP